MKLCSECAKTVSLIDIITMSRRMTARLAHKGETCDDCKCVVKQEHYL